MPLRPRCCAARSLLQGFARRCVRAPARAPAGPWGAGPAAFLFLAILAAGCDFTPGSEAIERGRDRWVNALNQGHADGAGAPYENTGVLLPPGENAVVGREAITEWWRELLGEWDLRFEFDEAGLDEDGRIGYRYGTYRLSGIHRSTGEVLQRESDFLQIWRRQRDGTWRLALDVWYPAAGAPDGAAASP